jgi:hypothetical protein
VRHPRGYPFSECSYGSSQGRNLTSSLPVPGIIAAGDVSDGYLGLIPDESPESGRVIDLLNKLTAAAECRWKWDSRGYITVRGPNVGLPESVPASTLQDIYERALAQRGLTLEDYVWIARHLTDRQIDSLARRELRPGRAIVMNLPGAMFPWAQFGMMRGDLRFWGSLSDEQRTHLAEAGRSGDGS